MGQLTTSGKDITLDSGLPNTLYVGLSSTTPAADGSNITEPTIGVAGYARKAITLGAAASNLRSNTGAIQFAASGGDWGTMTYSTYFLASTGGTAFAFDDLTAARNMVDGATMDMGIGAIDFGL